MPVTVFIYDTILLCLLFGFTAHQHSLCHTTSNRKDDFGKPIVDATTFKATIGTSNSIIQTHLVPSCDQAGLNGSLKP